MKTQKKKKIEQSKGIRACAYQTDLCVRHCMNLDKYVLGKQTIYTYTKSDLMRCYPLASG